MSEIKTYNVSGMTCGGCANNVAREVKRVEGVVDVQVDLASGKVTVTSDQPVAPEAIASAVTDAGYEVVS